MNIPLVDLGWQHDQISEELEKGLNEVFIDTSFMLGAQVGEFEVAFADYVGTRHCIGVGNGTDALELSVRALGIGPGDTVVVPANSFIASALGVLRAGADVVLVDCDPDHYLIDPDQIAESINPSVRAVMPVHLFGQLAPVDQFPELPDRVAIIEDAAQSQGATRHGRGSGSFGVVAGTSFYPGKNIGAYGDAGAVLTNDDDVASLVRKLGNWGSPQKYHHPEVGFNSRLDTVQAVVLKAKLAHLGEWNELRRAAASRYMEMLDEVDQVGLPSVMAGNEHIWHLFVVRVPERDRVLAGLHERGIGAGVHYPIPMHLQGALAQLGYGPGDFPNTEKAAEQILSLPIYPGITEGQQSQVVDALVGSLRA